MYYKYHLMKNTNMLLNPLLRVRIPPTFFKQIRSVRPTLKIDNDKFKLTINVHHFSKDEIRVKARPEYVIIEGKQEKKLKRGYICRSFVRKFKLPKGIRPEKIKSTLTPDGVLTITAPIRTCDHNFPCETFVPIQSTEQKPPEESILPPPADEKKNE